MSQLQVEGVDLATLSAWMDEEGLPGGSLELVEPMGGGTQNIILRLRRGGSDYILRRPPLHKRGNSDETMRREARVLAALVDTDVPHPRLIAACADEAVLGAAFYLMEPVDGFNPTLGLPDLHRGDAGIRHQMGLEMADAIAALGRVDHLAVGLADLGRTEGFLDRQVARWRRQLESYSELPGYPGPEIPGVEQVATWLDGNRPANFTPGIIHGDFHLANVLFSPTGPELVAMVDWELTTIGDPLIDLGWLLATWPPPDEPPAGIDPWEGFPTVEELLKRYCEGSTRNLDGVSWYRVLACYKLGIILEGTHARACAGQAERAVGDQLHASTISLFERAVRWIGEG